MAVNWIEVEGTIGKERDFYITKGGDTLNLSGYTITMKVWKKGSSTLFTGSVDIVGADTGLCKYALASDDIEIGDKGDDYLFSLSLVKGDENPIITKPKNLRVLEGPPA